MIQIPEKFQKDLQTTREIIEAVNVHHPHLEGMLLWSIHCDISNRATLVIGVPDTGKSRVAKVVEDSTQRQSLNPHGITVNGLKYYAEKLTDSSTTVIVEDLSRSGNDYMKINTVSVLSGLSYTGFVEKHNQAINLSISHCRMSALIFAQPLMLRSLVSVDEFDSDIRDKCMRYYHLFRPSNPFPKPLDVRVKYSSLDRQPVGGDGLDDVIIENLRNEVSKGRAIEHNVALVEASARLNQRNEITEADKWIVRGLTNNMKLEGYLFSKHHLEGARHLDIDAIPIFTAFLSFPHNTVKSIGIEFGVSETRTREILNTLGKWVMVNSKNVYPTPEAKRIMKEIRFDGDIL